MMERKTRVYKGKKLENTFVVKSLILYLLHTGIFLSKTFSMKSIELLPVICVLIFVYTYCSVSFYFGITGFHERILKSTIIDSTDPL